MAIRIRPRQEDLFADGSREKHFAVVSNIWEWTPERLIEWHREKAETIEAVHDVVKNESAGGVMPSKYFGANAAWLRLAVIAHNVLTTPKRIALPAEWLRALPKLLGSRAICVPRGTLRAMRRGYCAYTGRFNLRFRIASRYCERN